MSTRVLLIDDHALFRRGVAQLIESDPELQFVGEACDGARGIELAGEVEPDIVLIDLNMKGMSGIATLQGIKKANPRTCCIMLTVSDDERDVLQAMRADQAKQDAAKPKPGDPTAYVLMSHLPGWRDHFLTLAGLSKFLQKPDSGIRKKRHGRGWLVRIRHPWQPGRYLAGVWLRDRALGTSAATFQYLEHEGKKLGHVLDPRTGWCAEGLVEL